MSSLQEVLRRYGKQYLRLHGVDVPLAHREVLQILPMCRTPALGTAWYRCPKCRKAHALSRSCGNRHCATCQQERSQKWLQQQLDRRLPCEHFLVTFPLPAELRGVARSHQRVVYNALLQASAESMKTLAADPKHLGSRRLGFSGVLHTWGRTLNYHPHAHYIVPSGAVSEDGARWIPCAAGFFLPGKPLAMLFRGKFRAALEAAGLADQVDPAVWKRNWVVDIQPVGDGRSALKYLAPYVFRVAISDGRIESSENGQVCFRYTPTGSRRQRTMTLDAMEFLRRFLQHVLPKGFHKVRHHGFLHPNSKHSIELVRMLIRLSRGDDVYLEFTGEQNSPVAPQSLRCPDCGERLVWMGFEPPRVRPDQAETWHDLSPGLPSSRAPPPDRRDCTPDMEVVV